MTRDKFIVLTALTLMLTGCAEPAPPPQLHLSLAAGSPFHDALEVGVAINSVTGIAGWKEGIWTTDAKILMDAYLQSQGMKAAGPARYDINITLATALPPANSSSPDMTTDETIRYEVINNADQSVVFKTTVQTAHTVKFGEVFPIQAAIKRSVEGATRKNFIQFLEQLTASGILLGHH